MEVEAVVETARGAEVASVEICLTPAEHRQQEYHTHVLPSGTRLDEGDTAVEKIQDVVIVHLGVLTCTDCSASVPSFLFWF